MKNQYLLLAAALISSSFPTISNAEFFGFDQNLKNPVQIELPGNLDSLTSELYVVDYISTIDSFTVWHYGYNGPIQITFNEPTDAIHIDYGAGGGIFSSPVDLAEDFTVKTVLNDSALNIWLANPITPWTLAVSINDNFDGHFDDDYEIVGTYNTLITGYVETVSESVPEPTSLIMLSVLTLGTCLFRRC